MTVRPVFDTELDLLEGGYNSNSGSYFGAAFGLFVACVGFLIFTQIDDAKTFGALVGITVASGLASLVLLERTRREKRDASKVVERIRSTPLPQRLSLKLYRMYQGALEEVDEQPKPEGEAERDQGA